MQIKKLAYTCFALLVVSAVAGAQEPIKAQKSHRGQEIFLGRSADAGTDADGPCSRCHGHDGRGTVESGLEVPAIHRSEGGLSDSRLTASRRMRPAYTLQSFTKAVRHGIDANDRLMSAVMPRYDLVDKDIESLWHYLEKVRKIQGQGIEDKRLLFTVVSEDLISADAIAKALTNQFLVLPSSYDRQLQVRSEAWTAGVSTSCPGEGSLALVLSAAANSTQFLAAAEACQIPVIAPLFSLTGFEDPNVVRGMSASLVSQWKSLETWAGESLALLPTNDLNEAEANAIKFAFPDPPQLNGHKHVLAPFGLGRSSPTQNVTVLAPVQGATKHIARWRQNANKLVIATPFKRHQEDAQLTIDMQVKALAQLLKQAAEQAGPSPSRFAFVKAFDNIGLDEDFWLPLNYRANRLTGTREVTIIEVAD